MRYLIAFIATCLLGVSSVSHALDIPLSISNRTASSLDAEPITSGIPFAKGVLSSTAALRLLQNGEEIPAQFLPTAFWPDRSIRWVLADFQIKLQPNSIESVVVNVGVAPQPVSGVMMVDENDHFRVQTGSAEYLIYKDRVCLGERCFQAIYSGNSYSATPTSAWQVEEQGPLKAVLRVEGVWRNGSSPLRDDLVRFRARFIFYRNKDYVRLFLTFRNNNSHGWQPENPNRKPDLVLAKTTFGVDLISSSDHVFGNGVEKTWEIVSSPSGVRLEDPRYLSNGEVDPRFSSPRPLALANPEYYANTGAWGKISLPRHTSDTALQADFDRFEKLQRSKVSSADVENQPGKEGISVWGHMYQDIDNWNHYGGLRWGGGYGPVSDNHYDWSFGMYLQLMRTGFLPFADAARVFARHEIDFGIYHTNDDGPAFNYQKNWESRPSDDGPGNEFGGGRPSHTWVQGSILHYLLTGDPRGKDGYEELREGIRQYLYESFNGEGYLQTRELRIPGWITQNLTALWRVDPFYSFSTTSYGNKPLQTAIQDTLHSVFDYEAADGGAGYVYVGYDPDPQTNLRQPLMNIYFLNPAIDTYREIFVDNDPNYASNLLALIRRMTDWIMSVTYGGVYNSDGQYMPRQVPYMVDTTLSKQSDGQVPYILMAADAAGFLYTIGGESRYFDYARACFQDYSRYLNVAPGDYWIEPSERSHCSYNSSVYPDTESKIHGWSNRYGQYYLDSEGSNDPGSGGGVTDRELPVVRITSPRRGVTVRRGSAIRGRASDNVLVVEIQYRFNRRGAWKRVSGTTKWSVKISKKSKRGRTVFEVRAKDSSGNLSKTVKLSFVLL